MNPQTMFIAGQDGNPVMINTADFDAATMRVYGETDHAPENAETITFTPIVGTVNPGDVVTIPDGNTTTITTEAPKMFVGKKGRKHIVVDKDGQPIEAEGIDAAGYGSEAEAWAAIMARNTG